MTEPTNPVTVFIFKARGVGADAKHPTRSILHYPSRLGNGIVVTLDDLDEELYNPAVDWLEQRFWSGKRKENPDDETAVGFDKREVVLATMNLAHRLGDMAALEYANERLVYMMAQTPPGSLNEWRPLLGLPADGGFANLQEEVAAELDLRFVHLGESPTQDMDPGEKWGLRTKKEYDAFVERLQPESGEQAQ